MARLVLKAGGKAGVPVRKGLISEHKFSDGAGTVLKDFSGKGNNGTLATAPNTPTWSSEGLAFAVDDYVYCPSILPQTDFSVMIAHSDIIQTSSFQSLFTQWVSGGAGRLDVSLEKSTSPDGYITWLGGSRLISGTTSGSIGITTLTRNSSTFTLYENSTSCGSGFSTAAISTAPFRYGTYSGGASAQFLNGTIYYCVAYNRPLSTNEIIANHNYIKSYLSKSRGVTIT